MLSSTQRRSSDSPDRADDLMPGTGSTCPEPWRIGEIFACPFDSLVERFWPVKSTEAKNVEERDENRSEDAGRIRGVLSNEVEGETVAKAETGLEIVLTKIRPGGRVCAVGFSPEMITHNDK